MTEADHVPPLPAAYSSETLGRNLVALGRTQPALADRLCLPVDHGRVVFRPDARYRIGKGLFPLALDPATAERAPTLVGSPQGSVLVLGVGLGEQVDRLLEAGFQRIVAWERDPWLLRLFLMRRDRRGEIEQGRLRLALCADLLDVDARGVRTIEHPLLGKVYSTEIEAFRGGIEGRRALLCTGGLFVAQLGRALGAEGFVLWSLDVCGLAAEEIDRTVRRFDPQVVAAINYTNGLAELCQRHGAKLLCWEIDPATTAPSLDRSARGAAHVFTYRRAQVDVFRRAGFEHVRHMPLAADPEVRRKLELSGAEREKYGAPVAFVGSSLVRNVESFRAAFRSAWTEWRGGGEGAEAEAEADGVLQDVLAEQRRDFSRYRVPDLLAERAPGFLEAFRGRMGAQDPGTLVGEIAATEKRMSYAANLGSLGLVVWGDPGWRLIEQHGVRYRGPAAHEGELTRIYNAATINLDIGRIYQSDIVTMRTFDVLACGGFLLVEHTPDLEDLFEVGVEVESYRTLGELKEKIAHYLAHPGEAREIARRGCAAVLERHTIRSRLGNMLAAIA